MIISAQEIIDTLAIEIGENPTAPKTITRLITRATSWVEKETHRRFNEPVSQSEYRSGNGTDRLLLAGHHDTTQSPTDTLTVAERWLSPPGAWTTLEADAFEERDDMIVRLDGDVWRRECEYKITYKDGYVVAPDDIKALVTELVVGQWNADAAMSGDDVLKSETLVGVYSYTTQSDAATTAGAPGGGTISAVGQRTLDHYRRRLV